jgi:hypothetical protein
MKKQLFFGVILAVMSFLPSALHAQSTEGTDFWVTLMRGDNRNYDDLLLTFSANHATKVYIENKVTGYRDTVEVGDNDNKQLNLNEHEESCYVTDLQEETPVFRALHVTADKPISLIAANYKDKSFDVASILPTRALLSEYRIQCYTPYDHEHAEGKDNKHEQGSHFAIIAADDNVVVDITPSAPTNTGKPAGVTFATDTLKKGQVYYVWTGVDQGGDFTGTSVKARDGKKIAVFNGNSHTNIPTVRDRDHVYSQAMPINYWGRRFAITSSLTTIDGQAAGSYWERIDKIRVQALVDSTVVKLDGKTIHIFSFEKGNDEDKKHFFEFDFGAKDGMTNYDGDGHMWYDGVSHFIETSCPCAVHLFMTSNRYDHKSGKYCNGDPSEIWVNPIEQKIKELTFGTFETQQVKDHFINIITTKDNVASVRYDGDDISGLFQDLNGNSEYVFARLTNVSSARAHTLVSDSGFIAHVYGFGEKESYGYPAGGNTRDLSATLYINDEPYSSEGDNLLCGDKSVLFECRLDYEPDSIYWNFGDGADTLLIDVDSIRHFYDVGDRGNVNFEAYVKIFREIGSHDDDCFEWTDYDYDSIHFHVNVGMPTIEVKRIEIPRCIPLGTATDIQIILDNPAKVDLTSDSVKITFTQAALDAKFKNEDIKIIGDSMIVVHVPADTPDRTPFNMHIHIGSKCESTVFDKDIEFHMEYAIKQLEQRYNNVLGLIASKYTDKTLSDFEWYHDSVLVANQQSSVLYLDENDPETSGDYFVCYTVKEAGKEEFRECTCPVTFNPDGTGHSFTPDETGLNISGTVAIKGNTAFVNADWQGKTDIECFAQWISVTGSTSQKYNIPDGGRAIPTPTENGFYILRVVTDGAGRSFKIYINH